MSHTNDRPHTLSQTPPSTVVAHLQMQEPSLPPITALFTIKKSLLYRKVLMRLDLLSKSDCIKKSSNYKKKMYDDSFPVGVRMIGMTCDALSKSETKSLKVECHRVAS